MEDMLCIRISLDGDKWSALIGENPQVGVIGFGDSPLDALFNLLAEIEDGQPVKMNHFDIG